MSSNRKGQTMNTDGDRIMAQGLGDANELLGSTNTLEGVRKAMRSSGFGLGDAHSAKKVVAEGADFVGNAPGCWGVRGATDGKLGGVDSGLDS
ncbi:unnamed protein product [Ilex paraguariensis]|uniref:Uncharacterized protein n=2 Tax=Ilex paraguariensis TaxID=185542 RepID=A0ABC8V5L7_9AQUA